MWVPKEVADWFRISKDSVDALREENSSLKSENNALKLEAARVNANFDWLRMRVNSLEIERAALLKVAYNINVPAPEIAKEPYIDPSWNPKDFSFEDIGDDLARKIGLPVYDIPEHG